MPELKITEQLPISTMQKVVKGISYLAHSLRLRILEYLDVKSPSSVSSIAKMLNRQLFPKL